MMKTCKPVDQKIIEELSGIVGPEFIISTILKSSSLSLMMK
ncbi:MAG: hypothetical protein ACQES4_03650 [Bacillota bacterium]